MLARHARRLVASGDVMFGIPLSMLATWATWAGLAAGLAITAWIAIGRKPRGLRCRRCDYDMEDLGLFCPECGTKHRTYYDLRIRRRPWKLIPVAVIGLTALPVWTGWQEPIRRAWWRLTCPEWIVLESARSGPLEVRILQGGRPDTSRHMAYELRWSGQEPVRLRGRRNNEARWAVCGLAKGPALPGTLDLTADGLPELIIETHDGGNDTWSRYLVFDPTRPGHEPYRIDLMAAEFRDAGPGVPARVHALDGTLDSWRAHQAGSAVVPIVLVWNGERLAADPSLTAVAQGLERETVQSLARLVNPVRGASTSFVDPLTVRSMWSLVYAGREIEAWELFSRVASRPHTVAHPGWNDVGRDSLVREFRDRIRSSPWWDDLFGASTPPG